MGEPVSLGAMAFKAVAAVGPVTIKLVADEWARRKADLANLDPAALDRETNEALDVLIQANETLFKAVSTKAKALAVGVPKIFSDAAVRDWLQTQPVRNAVKGAAVALLTKGAVPDARNMALADFGGADELRPGLIVAFEYAVAFACQSVIRKLTTGDRLILSRLDAGFSELREQATPAASASLSRTLLDQAARVAIERVRIRRVYPEVDVAKEALVLAEQLRRGEFGGASNKVRAEGLARCARWLALGEHGALAPGLALEARALGASAMADIAEAIIAGRDSEAAGLKALSPINSPAKRGAALMLVAHKRDLSSALSWAEAAQIKPEDLEPEGRANLLIYAVASQEWDRALKLVTQNSDDDYRETPLALHFAGIAHLAAAMAPDVREALLHQAPPLQAADLPLADGPEALVHRARARGLFERASDEANKLDCAKAACASKAYALWLGLRDSAQRETALADLVVLMRDAERAIAYLPLALAFDIAVDRAKIDQELGRLDALEPEGTSERAIARFAMANTAGDPESALNYLRRHRAGMVDHILHDVLVGMEVQLLARVGKIEEARANLDAAENMQEANRAKLQELIGNGSTGPTVESLEAWYEADPTTFNLRKLVERLARSGYSDRWFELATRLVETTGALAEAEAIVEFLAHKSRPLQLETILEKVADLVPLSPRLRSALAWANYRRGDVKAAEELVQALRLERDDQNDRALLVNILIATGRWDELPPHVEQEWLFRNARSAAELINLAHLAASIGSARASEFARLAVERAPDDANILVAAYTTSSEAGVEDGETAQWIARAHELSDENGPVTTGSIEQIFDQADAWNRHVDDIWQKIKSADVPLAIAAPALRRTSLDLQLTPMVLNPLERDPRRRSVAPLFSGARGNVLPGFASVGLDGSSIISLGLLGLLEAFARTPIPVFIPQATLSWLFQERHRLRFHQPSQIARAEALVRDIAARRLSIFTASALPPAKLIDEVGMDLANMLAAALLAHPGGAQRVVVRPAPLHKVGSFLSENATIGNFAAPLVSCSRVIDRLVETNVINAAEEAYARAYLTTQREERWPNELEIQDGAELYLDDLAVSYLRTIKVLDRLHAGGVTAKVSEQRVEEANAFVQLKDHTGAIEDRIESIRSVLASAIATGAIRLDREIGEKDDLNHPNLAAIKLASKVDAVVSDERFLNKTRFILDEGNQAEILCSLDVIEYLRRQGDIDLERYIQSRTMLRRAGAIFISPTAEELSAFLERAPIRDGELRETLELRAFRENLQIAQMRGWLQLPGEIGFVQRLHNAIADTIQSEWEEGKDWAKAALRSNWVLNAIDFRNWLHAPAGVDIGPLALYGHTQLISRLFLSGPPLSVRRKAGGLDEWLENTVVASLNETDAAAVSWMLSSVKALVTGTIGSRDDG